MATKGGKKPIEAVLSEVQKYWKYHSQWIQESEVQETARQLKNKTAYSNWRKERKESKDYPASFNRFKRNLGNFGDARNQSVRIAHAKMVESERKANMKAQREPLIEEGITWLDVRPALLTSKELRALKENPKERKVTFKGTDKEVKMPTTISPVQTPPKDEAIIATKMEIEEITPEGLVLPSAKVKKQRGRPPKIKEFKLGSSATAQVWNKMLEESSSLGDKYICLSSYSVGDKILQGDTKSNISGVLELSQNLLQFQEKKSAELSSFLNALAHKAPKSDIMEGIVEIMTEEGIQTIEFDPKIPETYFDLKDLTSQLKKVSSLQDICEHYSDLQTKEGSLQKDKLFKEKATLEGFDLADPKELEKIKAQQEQGLQTAQAQLATLEKDLQVIQKEAKTARKTLKTEEKKTDSIKAQSLKKKIENEWEILTVEKLNKIQGVMNKEIRAIKTDDPKQEKKIQEVLDTAYEKIRAIAPNITSLAEKDKKAWKLWGLIAPEEKQHIGVGKITGGKLKKEGLLTNFRENKNRAGKFFKEYKGDYYQFSSEVKEAILSPHSGVEKIVQPVKKVKEKKKKSIQDKLARRKLKSIHEIVMDLRKEMNLDSLKAKKDRDLTQYASNVKTLIQADDFNITAIPRQTMTQLIAEQYKSFSK